MSITPPTNFRLDLDLIGVPTNYKIGITELPKINIGVDPIEIGITQLPKINIGIDPIEIKPIDLSFRIKEVPSLRVSFPVDYQVAFGLFGVELACIHLCGQSQVITEPYVANPCECPGAVSESPGPVTVVKG
jgi:hypothetical protein